MVIYLKIMTIGRKFGHTARRSHKFHIKCNIMYINIFNIVFCILRVGKWKWYKW